MTPNETKSFHICIPFQFTQTDNINVNGLYEAPNSRANGRGGEW